MRLPLVLGVLALTLAPPALAAATTPAPAEADPALAPLLQRLAEAERARKARSEGRATETTIVTEELDKEGKPEKRTEMVLRRTVKDGQATTELVRQLVDGKDVTEEHRKKFEERQRERKAQAAKDKAAGKESRRGLSFDMSPFAAGEQPRYAFEPLPARPSDPPGHQRIALRPRGKAEETMLKGEALVDVAAGELVRFDGTLAKLPRFADRVQLTLEFGPTELPGRDLTRTRMEGEGGLLFVRKRVRSDTRIAYLP